MRTAAAMQARISKQEIIANNLANVTTSGFKRDRIFQEVLDEESMDQATSLTPTTVFEQGSLKETQNSTDVALQGKGFFVVETLDGPRYTRNGHFQRNANGELITDSGLPVLGKNGPVSGQGALTIDESGQVYLNGELTDSLMVVELPESVGLKKIGNSLFALVNLDDVGFERDAESAVVKQGYLEESNVNAVEEMVRMMTVYRHFEADEKAMRTQDDILGRVVNDIARVQ
jgi:flagellar basal-body rod protein FlgG